MAGFLDLEGPWAKDFFNWFSPALLATNDIWLDSFYDVRGCITIAVFGEAEAKFTTALHRKGVGNPYFPIYGTISMYSQTNPI